MKCRHCLAELSLSFVDLGTAPASNAYLHEADLQLPERWFPLRVLVCRNCWLAQTEDFADFNDLFSSDYAYFSSYSDTWLKHAEAYVADVTERFGLNRTHFVVEVAANDGYLLQYVKKRGIPCLGIEPTRSTAAAARNRGIEIREEFFGVAFAERLLEEGRKADLMIANNVLAHVPNINDFVAGFASMLSPRGVATFEFPNLLSLVEKCQFDTIYHEHFSYLSLSSVHEIFDKNGLSIFDVEGLDTHGGSLRVFAQLKAQGARAQQRRVTEILDIEAECGVRSESFYSGFQLRANSIKNEFVNFLIEARARGDLVIGYGAAAKGNTLLNYAGVKSDLLGAVADRNPAKQGKYLPGSRIPVVKEDYLKRCRPRFIVILPWNLQVEVEAQLSYVREWGGAFVRAVPRLAFS